MGPDPVVDRCVVGWRAAAQRAPERLEDGFALVMGVVAAEVVDVHRHLRVVDQPLEKLAGQVDVELADHRAGEFDLPGKAGAAREIHHHPRQRFIQRHIRMAVAANAPLVPDRFSQRLSERDADVLHRVMRIDVQVAAGLDDQVDQAVTRDLVEHVVKERDTSVEPRSAAAVEIELDANQKITLRAGYSANADVIIREKKDVLVLPEPGPLLPMVRERVTASVLLQRRVLVTGRRGLTVIARRPPRGSGEITWAYDLDPGVDPSDPEVVRAAEEGLRAAQEELGSGEQST